MNKFVSNNIFLNINTTNKTIKSNGIIKPNISNTTNGTGTIPSKINSSIINMNTTTNKIIPIKLKSDYLNQKIISEKINSNKTKKKSNINLNKNKNNKKNNSNNSFLRNFDFSNDISLDQVEAKLNRFSIAKDSLESSLVNAPYSIEVN
jgi:hypothetical protein